MKVLAFAATNSLSSINKKLVTYAGEQLKSLSDENVEVEVLDLNDYEMPIYRPDRQKENGIPEPAHEFLRKISAADKILISFAEYNGSYTAAYKNIFDWASRIDMKLYQSKPVILMATSPGRRGGMGVLKAASDGGPHFGMDIKGQFSLPEFSKNFDVEKNEVSNTEKKAELIDLLQQF